MDAVRAEEVVLAYGRHVALRASTFTVPAQRATAVIGPNGSAKSTLLDAIAGLHRPASGTVLVGDRPATLGDPDVAYVLQSAKVSEHLPVTVGEVVAMGRYTGRGLLGRLRADDRAAIDDAMQRLEIEHLRDRHLGELSGGERQRVLVAQGVAQAAGLLLLDEPVTGLDLASRQRILEVMAREVDRGTTVVFSTHDLGEAKLADHVILLAGRVVATGPPDHVLTREHLAEAYTGRVLQLAAGELLLDDVAHTHSHTRESRTLAQTHLGVSRRPRAR